jgi:hypothetical protein
MKDPYGTLEIFDGNRPLFNAPVSLAGALQATNPDGRHRGHKNC